MARGEGTRRPKSRRFEGRHLAVEYVCGEDYCTIFFGPKHDPVLRHTAVINVERGDFRDLARDAYELFQRLLEELEEPNEQ